jgi:uncharacterized membrane protein
MTSAATAIHVPGTDTTFGHLAAEAWRHYRIHAGLLMLCFLTIVGAWVVLELLVMWGNRLGVLYNLALHFLFLVAAAGLQAGFLKIALDINDGETVGYRRLFSKLRNGPSFLAAQVTVCLLVLAGLVFFVVPGIYFGARYGLFGAAIADRGVGTMESLSMSSRLSKGRRMKLAILGVQMAVMNVLGAALLGVGLLVTVPLSVLMMGSVYRRLAGDQAEG